MRADRGWVVGAILGIAAIAAPLLLVQQVARSESPPQEGAKAVPPVIDPAGVRRLDSRLPDPAPDGGAGEAPDATPRNPLRPIWEASLAAREEALAKAREALAKQLEDVRRLEAQVDARLQEANRRLEQANKRWEENARLKTPTGASLPQTLEEANAQLDKLVAIIKKMKPADAAEMVSKWHDALLVDVLARLPARSASPVLAKMAPKDAARVTAMLARGGAPTPGEPAVDAAQGGGER
ncbi:MAG: hypothetical protein CVU56_25085 [Deltaproteobacteria bacterium HGW-Deltaproteobacteria-14]|jgi:flagellar motility protein MotE (MotC chaperone)|nr:MAG: hypothetical protein CVU56_25085 [Deltaproteobacteria bacterium HGW-Deltaproteobacteria-14]